MTTAPTITAAAAPATTWPEFATTYRRTVASYLEAIKVDRPEAQARANRAYGRAFDALLDYPVTTPGQLAEKVELIFLVEAAPEDLEKIEPALKRDTAAFVPVVRGRDRDLTHDLIAAGCRVEPGPVVKAWLDSEAAWVASVGTMRMDPTDDALDAEAAAWGALIRTEAPSLRALLMKFEAVLACHLHRAGSSLHSPEDVAELAAVVDCRGPAPLVAMWRDLQRLAGVLEPISPKGA